MHRSWIVGAAMACGVGGLATGTLQAQQRIDRRLAVTSHASIRIHNLVGTTRIIGWDRDSLVVEGTVGRGGGSFYLGGGGSGAKLGVEVADQPDPAPTHLVVHVPRRARVWVKSASADIEVTGAVRGLDLNSVSGTIVVRAVVEELSAETMDGGVVAIGASWTRIKTGSGAIELTGGDDVAIGTVTGTVRYVGDQYRRVRLESVSGDLWFRGGLPPGARVEAESHSGRVELSLSDDVSAEFSLSNFSGGIESAFGPRQTRVLPERDGRVMEFSVGRGEANVTVRNFKGDIVLRRQ